MTRALISGITGSLGRALASQLAARGMDVHGLSRGGPHPYKIAGTVHRVDADTESLVSIVKAVRPEVVFHIAGLIKSEHRVSDVLALLESNFLFGTQLLEASYRTGCRNHLYAGSYLQRSENGECRPFNLYAAAKQAFEGMLAYYVDVYEMSAIALTVCNFYDESDGRRSLITDIADACVTGSSLELRNENVYIDPIHVDDAALAFVRAASLLETGAIQPGTLAHYSVSSGGDLSSRELIAAFERVCQKKIDVECPSSSARVRRQRPWRGAPVPGWSPTISLEEGFARLIAKRRETYASR